MTLIRWYLRVAVALVQWLAPRPRRRMHAPVLNYESPHGVSAWARLGGHKALVRQRTIDDDYYRVSPERRATLVARITARILANCEPDSEYARDWMRAAPGFSPYQIVSIARAHRVRRPWRLHDAVLNLFRAPGIFEYITTAWVWEQDWPAWLGVVLCSTVTMAAHLWSEVALERAAQPDTVPAYVLPALRESAAIIRIVHTAGAWHRVGAWTIPTPAQVVAPPGGHLHIDLLQLAAVAVLVCSLVFPDSPTSVDVHIAAIGAAAVWNVRTDGNANNGGFYVSGGGGTDRSLQAAAQVAIDNSTIVCSTPSANSNTLTFVSGYTTSTADVGNGVYVVSGTNVNVGWFQITGRTSSTWTLSGSQNLTTAGGAGSAIVANMGGATSSPGRICASTAMVNSNTAYVKSGTYSMTTTSSNVDAGRMVSAATPLKFEGYQTTYGDRAARPLIQASGISSATMCACSNEWYLCNLEFDGASLTSMRGVDSQGSNRWTLHLCKLDNFTNKAVNFAVAGQSLRSCQVTGCSTTAALSDGGTSGTFKLFFVVANDNTITGVSHSGSSAGCGTVWDYLSDSNSGASTDGILWSNPDGVVGNSILYNSGRDGLRTTSSALVAFNVIMESNAGYGANATSGATQDQNELNNCASYDNTSGRKTGTWSAGDNNQILGTSSFFVDAANQDFRVNNNATGGALVRGAGYSTMLVGGTGYLDTGLLQHQDAGGGPVGGSMRGGFVN